MHLHSITDTRPSFDFIYERYGPLLYGIALRLSLNPDKADILLLHTFKQVYHQPVLTTHQPLFMNLVKALIQCAGEQLRLTPEDINKRIGHELNRTGYLLQH